MNTVFLVAAGIAAAVHLLIFVMESLAFHRVHERFMVAGKDVGAVRSWAFNQGFYNLFLALGALAGPLRVPDEPLGQAIAAFACACMLGAAVVLIVTDRRMLRGALMQGLPPLVALVALWWS